MCAQAQGRYQCAQVHRLVFGNDHQLLLERAIVNAIAAFGPSAALTIPRLKPTGPQKEPNKDG